MVLVDFSQTCIASLHQQLKYESQEVEPEYLRHMILNSIRKINKEFVSTYGRLVICTDDNTSYWRRTYFPYYKANRKKKRDESDIDWPLVFKTLDQLKEELRANFPYKVMAVPSCEADDIIGILAKHFHQQEKVLILSGDEDFLQLQKYPNVVQYAPTKDKFLTTDDPIRFLKEHIMRGDKGDGVPNFLSADDCLVTGVRQKSVYEKKLEVWVTQQPEEFCDEQQLINYHRNEKLVDLSQIPDDVESAILEEFSRPIEGNRTKIYGYLIKNRMVNLLSSLKEF